METTAAFRVRYRNDFAALIHDCVDWGNDSPTDYQYEILEMFSEHRRIAVRGPHGIGKTALAAWVIISFVLTRENSDWKCPTTASAWRQLTKYLWPEIHKWSRRIRWDKVGRSPFRSDTELQKLSIKLATGEAFAVTSNDHEQIEGAHADHLLYVFDESKAIPVESWDAIEGAFSTGDCGAFAISTPGNRSGRFYDINRRAPGTEEWTTRHVTLEEAVAAGRVSREWATNKKKLWGENSPIYQARVLGEFPEQSEDQLISLSWIERARVGSAEKTEDEDIPVEDIAGTHVAGVDVARYGDDDSCWIERRGIHVLNVEVRHGHDTMQIAGLVRAKGVPAKIDEIGVGSGVVDRLLEDDGVQKPFECEGINVGAKARNSDEFDNIRSEGFWDLRLRFQNGEIDLSRIDQDSYDRLSGELTSIKFGYNSRGKTVIEPKDITKKRLGRSPDFADALMICFYGDGVAAPEGVSMEYADDSYIERRWRV